LKSYKLYKKYPDRFSAVIYDSVREPWISLQYVAPNHEIRVQTNDPIYYTNALINFYLVVTLDDYVILNPVIATHVQTVPINLHNCQITDFTFPTLSAVEYNVYTPIIHILMTRFTETSRSNPRPSSPTTCGYAVTYTVKWRDFYDTVIPLPPWIVWNPTAFRYEVQTDDPNDIIGTR
jgi:hypothetical protein